MSVMFVLVISPIEASGEAVPKLLPIVASIATLSYNE